jgi:hypothetical protein
MVHQKTPTPVDMSHNHLGRMGTTEPNSENFFAKFAATPCFTCCISSTVLNSGTRLQG